ncbi:MAG: tautomerase family protein [Pseudomonadota bacterium]
MPIVNVTLVRGRDLADVQEFCRQVTKAAEQHLHVRPEAVRVFVTEVEPELFFVAGKSKAELSA